MTEAGAARTPLALVVLCSLLLPSFPLKHFLIFGKLTVRHTGSCCDQGMRHLVHSMVNFTRDFTLNFSPILSVTLN